MTASGKMTASVRTFVTNVINGFVKVTHSSFALLGLAVAFAAIALLARPELRQAGEQRLMGWLQARQPVVAQLEAAPEPELVPPANRPIAINPKELPREQAAVAYWLSKKYRVAPEPIAALVTEAYDIGARAKLDPMLLLAIVAIESSFNPFAQSAVGAQGLMQVMTRVHTDKYQEVGGHLAAFNPLVNLRVGAKVLQECIARAGSLEGGCATTSAPPICPMTAATRPRCWPSISVCARSLAAARQRRRQASRCCPPRRPPIPAAHPRPPCPPTATRWPCWPVPERACHSFQPCPGRPCRWATLAGHATGDRRGPWTPGCRR